MTDPWAKDPELQAAMEALYGPLPITAGEGFLHHLKANPTLLDPAPDDREQWAQAMGRRGQDEIHPCLRCGKKARCNLIAETPIGPRFLDLCPDCRAWLQDEMEEAASRPW